MKGVTTHRAPGTNPAPTLDIEVAEQQFAASVTKRKGLSQDQWSALLDWLDFLQVKFPKHSAEEWKIQLKELRRVMGAT